MKHFYPLFEQLFIVCTILPAITGRYIKDVVGRQPTMHAHIVYYLKIPNNLMVGVSLFDPLSSSG